MYKRQIPDRESNTLASHGLEEPAHALRGLFLMNTLLLYPSLSPYTQTDRQTDGGMNTLASRGLEEPAHASRGLFLIHSLRAGWRNLPTLCVGWRKYRNLFLFLINTLLLCPSLSPYTHTDRQTD